MHGEGYGAMDSVRESAAGISTSLSIAADLIGRMWTTGGEGYSKAFGAAADNLELVLDARAVGARERRERARHGEHTNGHDLCDDRLYESQSALATIVRMPLVQVAYAVICLVIVYGHSQVSEIIENVV